MSTNKYDRQLRLWNEGQILILESRLIAFSSDALACETLKNLILAGVGYFTIVDDSVITQQDLKENFFLSAEDIGTSRAQSAVRNLKELNPDSNGDFILSSFSDFFNNTPNLILGYDILISSNLSDEQNLVLSKQAELNNQRLIIANCYGLLGKIRLFEHFHSNIQLKLTDRPIYDLRIVSPWPELKECFDSFDFQALSKDEMSHKHVPFVVILHKVSEVYKEKYGKLPSTFDEKKELKSIINSLAVFNKYVGDTTEENFAEAINFNYFASASYENPVTEDVVAILKRVDSEIQDLIAKSSDYQGTFFVVLKAINQFVNNNGTMPVVGSLPDMTSDTISYVKIKQIYNEKARRDREEVYKLAVDALIELALNEDKQGRLMKILQSKDLDLVTVVCKNWPQITLFEYNSLENELKAPKFSHESNDLTEEDLIRNAKWYCALRAVELFSSQNGRFPGSEEDFEKDIIPLKQIFLDQCKFEGLPFSANAVEDDIFYEVCRFSNSQIVPVVSVVGSTASQEILKLITYQFQTINNTIIYDAINSNMSTLNL